MIEINPRLRYIKKSLTTVMFSTILDTQEVQHDKTELDG